MPIAFDIDSLARRLANVGEELKQFDMEVSSVDLDSLTLEVFSYAKGIVELQDLEARLSAMYTIDFRALESAVELLLSKDLKPFQLQGGSTIEPNEVASKIRSQLAELRQNIQKYTPDQIAMALEWSVDHQFTELLYCAVASGVSLSDFVEKLYLKMKFLNSSQVAVIWPVMLAETDSKRHGEYIRRFRSVFPKGFFKYENKEDGQKKLAQYIGEYRPKALLAMFERGVTSYPVALIGPARVLAWNSSTDAEEVDPTERSLARNLARLAALWRLRNHTQSDEAIQILDLPKDSRILGGPDYIKLVSNRKLVEDHIAYCLYVLKDTVELLKLHTSRATPIERALFLYKLSLEVLCKETRVELIYEHETYLQRHASRFLLGQNIVSFGRKFGRSEIDLYIDYDPTAFIIEAKRYSKKSQVTAKSVELALVQLQSYMDQEMNQRRGVLLLFNFSKTLIIADRKWLSGKYWVLPINLMPDSPSRRRSSIRIMKGDGKKLIKVVKV